MKIYNYINGEMKEAGNGRWLDNIDPSTGQVSGYLPDSDEEDVAVAYEAAEQAFHTWCVRSPAYRAGIMRKIAALIDQQVNELAHAESQDNGKPVSLAMQLDIPRASSNIRFYAGAIEHFASESHTIPGVAINYTTRTPLGVVGCISPWNLPLYLFTWKIAPALAAGNTVVAKPSELSPVTAFLFSGICQEAGLPAGVLNVIHGKGSVAGEAIVKHPKISAISFTGGTATGRRIAGIAAPMFKKLSLELGGKNPTIIFEDCDLEETVSRTLESSFSNQGEICLCGSRLLIQESIYEAFIEKFIDGLKEWSTGDPRSEGTNLGALISENHLKKVMEYVQLAKEEGGEIRYGGNRIFLNGRCEGGYFHEPTIITGLSMECRTNSEEIFGPVVTIMSFADDEEAIRLANATEYGLSATIWTDKLTRAHKIAAQLNAGVIWVNCWLLRDLRTPFGGWKSSGVGREGGWEALRFFTETKNICIKL